MPVTARDVPNPGLAYDSVIQSPPREWVKDADDESVYTPDMWLLDEAPWHNLFVYNTFQRGLKDHEWFIDPDNCHGPLRRCLAFTQDQNFTLVKKNLGKDSFPIALVPTTELTSLQTGRIQGEIYKVRPRHFLMLDTWHENKIQFIRVRVNLTVPYSRITRKFGQSSNPTDEANRLVQSTVLTKGFKIVRAWMYIGVSSFWNPLLDAGYLYSQVKKYPHISRNIGECFAYQASDNIDRWSPDHNGEHVANVIDGLIKGAKREVLGHTLSGYTTYAECKTDQK